MTALQKLKRILTRWYGKQFTVYVGSTPFEVDVDKIQPWTGGPLELKAKPREEAR